MSNSNEKRNRQSTKNFCRRAVVNVRPQGAFANSRPSCSVAQPVEKRTPSGKTLSDYVREVRAAASTAAVTAVAVVAEVVTN